MTRSFWDWPRAFPAVWGTIAEPLSILFAPDYRPANAYQQHLAEALAEQDMSVQFPQGYHRAFPLTRSCLRLRPDLLHLHWPEAYFHASGPAAFYRRLRYPIDLLAATRKCPLVWTHHNRTPHDSPLPAWDHYLYQITLRRAARVIAHTPASSPSAKTRNKVVAISHGDPAAALPPPIARAEARRQLDWPPDTPTALIFGRIARYKRLPALVDAFLQAAGQTPWRIHIAGACSDSRLTQALTRRAEHPAVSLELNFLDNHRLNTLLCAADVALFNHAIQSSGAALLARMRDLPCLVPAGHPGLPIASPAHRHGLIEFDAHNLRASLDHICRLPPEEIRFPEALRSLTRWESVAQQTAAVYRRLCP